MVAVSSSRGTKHRFVEEFYLSWLRDIFINARQYVYRIIVSILTFLLIAHDLAIELREALPPSERHINMVLNPSGRR
jgi:hypothetical protein